MRSLFYCIVASLTVASMVFPHERREIGGMEVVFGGEPEPVIDGELRFLRWRFADVGSKQPATDLKDLQATIKFEGQEFGPFEARGSRRDPGMYQTHHVFMKPGEGEVTLTFKREGKSDVLAVTFPFRVVSRKTIEIP